MGVPSPPPVNRAAKRVLAMRRAECLFAHAGGLSCSSLFRSFFCSSFLSFFLYEFHILHAIHSDAQWNMQPFVRPN